MNKQIEQIAGKLVQRSVDLVSFEELKAKLDLSAMEKRPLRIKYGADPSAPNIHLGHVVGLNKLREFQEQGHVVIFLIGDFTGMIGDPSGRSQTRKPLSKEQVQENAKSYEKQVFRILDPALTEIRFNSEWCSPMKFEDVIRLSAHVTVAQMLARDDFSNRYGTSHPISLVEFLYPLIQAYDSVVLKADIELGGTDQLFNLLLGRELQKVFGQPPQVVMTLPLLEGLDGVNKMSKSLGNYIGVTDAPKDVFGKVMSVSDDLMWRYFSLVLCMTEEEIESLRQNMKTGQCHPRDIKDDLAKRVVAKFHGVEAGEKESAEFERVFSKHELPRDIPDVEISPSDVNLAALLVKAGLAFSNNEARRLIQQGAVEIAGHKVTDPKAKPDIAEGMIVRCGKRGFARIVRR